MKALKFFVIGLILGLLLVTAPATSIAAEDVRHIAEYRVAAIPTALRARLEKHDWKICGDYFARIETEEQNTIFFNIEKRIPGKPSFAITRPNFSNVEWVDASINEKKAFPVIAWNSSNDRYQIKMNMKDYMKGLPCFGKGVEI